MTGDHREPQPTDAKPQVQVCGWVFGTHKVLFGFPGRSLQDDLVRLYQSLALDAYVEVRRQDVLHSVRLDRSLPEATIMWLKRDAQVVHVTARSKDPGAGHAETRLLDLLRCASAPSVRGLL